ncbi:hypothetical protein Y032_0143g2387 [Ancylostoma ceylanicum]|uniref:Uncharacterized protein n=1 Tax=Ancylostoma ceylanicum TaxID=53326 RepID=A0A016T2A7_9BILA|nr:hypothetical protein Y032_0143g2387 [Ancylostoma ceylanicum]
MDRPYIISIPLVNNLVLPKPLLTFALKCRFIAEASSTTPHGFGAQIRTFDRCRTQPCVKMQLSVPSDRSFFQLPKSSSSFERHVNVSHEISVTSNEG